MKELYRVVLIVGLLSMLFLGSCTDNPTNPSSDVVIIVDNQNPNTVRPPCGTEDAVCGTITDGLLSAARSKTGIPTILVKSGTYDAEPSYPIQIHIPVILKAEQAREVVISSSRVTASDVTIEGVRIVSIGVDGGDVTLKNTSVKGGGLSVRKQGNIIVQNSRIEVGSMYVDEGGTAIIEESELYGKIRSDGCVTLNNSTIYRGCLYVNSGQVIMKNSTL